MFKNWFKPKWQSNNSDTRVIAVSQLNADTDEGLTILAQLAEQDPSLSVKVAAFKRVSHLPTIQKLASSLLDASSSEGQKALVDHIVKILSADEANLSEKMELLQTIKHPALATNLLASTAALELILTALGSISDPDRLQSICLTHRLARVRTTAAERIQSYKHLQTIHQQTKGKDKTIHRIAKNKLDKLKESVEALAKQKAQGESICAQLETLAQTTEDPLLYQKFDYLIQQWDKFESEQKQSFEPRVKTARTQISQRLNQREHDQEEAAKKTNVLMDAVNEQEEAIKTLQESVTLIQKMGPTLDTELPALKAILSTQKNRWESACETQTPTGKLSMAFTQCCRLLERYILGLGYLQKNQSNLKDLIAQVKKSDSQNPATLLSLHKKVKKALSSINWPEDIKRPELLNSIDAIESEQQKQIQSLNQLVKDIESSISEQIKKLDSCLTEGQLKPAQSHAQNIRNLTKKLPNDKQEKSQKAFKPLTSKLNEMRDWQGYATAPKKEELCDKMEALIENSMQPQDKADAIKALQTSWKSLGLLDKKQEQPLWKRFSDAADEAFKPCKAHFKNQADQRESNLERKQDICNQLDKYIKEYDWSKADWPAVFEVLKTAKAEWRRYSPVNKSKAKEVQARFDECLSAIQRKIDHHQTANLKQKQKLLTEAQQLHTDEDVIQAVEKIKELRASWSKVGMLPKKEYKAIQTEFDKACDAIFSRRKKLWDDTKAQKKHNEEQISLVIKRVKALIADEAADLSSQTNELHGLEQAFNEYQPLEKHTYNKLQNEIESTSKAFKRILRQAEQHKVDTSIDSLWKLSSLCRELESWVINNTLEQDKLQTLKQAWNSQAGAPETAAAALNRRFDAAIQAMTEKQPAQLTANQEKRLSIIRETTLKMEILAGVASPEEDKALRMEIQVNRLNDSMSRKPDKKEIDKNRRRLETEWCLTGPIETALLAPYEQRFIYAKNQLRGAP